MLVNLTDTGETHFSLYYLGLYYFNIIKVGESARADSRHPGQLYRSKFRPEIAPLDFPLFRYASLRYPLPPPRTSP